MAFGIAYKCAGDRKRKRANQQNQSDRKTKTTENKTDKCRKSFYMFICAIHTYANLHVVDV